MDVAMQSSDRALDGLLRPDQEDFKLDVIVPLTRIQSYLTEVAPEIVQTMEVQEIIPLIPVLAAHPDAKQGEELADRLQNAISTAKNRVHVPAAQACAAAAASVQSVQWVQRVDAIVLELEKSKREFEAWIDTAGIILRQRDLVPGSQGPTSH